MSNAQCVTGMCTLVSKLAIDNYSIINNTPKKLVGICTFYKYKYFHQ